MVAGRVVALTVIAVPTVTFPGSPTLVTLLQLQGGILVVSQNPLRGVISKTARKRHTMSALALFARVDLTNCQQVS